MKEIKIIAVLFFVLVASTLKAQKITMYKTFGGVRYMQGDTLALTDKQLLMVFYKENQAAYTEFKKAKGFATFSSFMGFAGGFLVAFPLATAAVGGDPEWLMAVGGVALIAGSIPLNRIYRGRALGAVDLYNEKLTSRIKPNLFFTGSKAGIVVKF